MGDDHVALGCGIDQLGRREVAISRVPDDIDDVGEVGKRPTVVRVEILRIVGDEHSHGDQR
jgi:hypothetical protein